MRALWSVLFVATVSLGAARAGELDIAVELPFGEASFEAEGIFNGVDMAISEAGTVQGFTLGTRRSDLTPHDDVDLATANAQAAVADGNVIGVVGPFDSFSTFVMNPI